MLTLPEVAKHFRVSTGVVKGWISSGLLPAINVAPQGSKRRHYRISEASLSLFETLRGTGNAKPSRVQAPVKEWV
jgi:transposase